MKNFKPQDGRDVKFSKTQMVANIDITNSFLYSDSRLSHVEDTFIREEKKDSIILNYIKGEARTMLLDFCYDDVIKKVLGFFWGRIDFALFKRATQKVRVHNVLENLKDVRMVDA